jgi:hypothetical protein
MGVSYGAYAVIGCEVTGKLYREVVRSTACTHVGMVAPAAAHLVPKFCPQCGKRQSQIDRVPIDAYNENSGTLNGLKVERIVDGDRAFAGIVVMANQSDPATCMMIPINEFDARAELVRTILDEIGLWDPNTFGLWALLGH